MKIRRAVIGFGLLTFAYLVLLIWVDSCNAVFDHIPALLRALPVLAMFSLASYLLRYLRWHWLLSRAGFIVPPGIGLLSYLAGFAFTATPGKVGELLRIRYLEPVGVPPYRVIACFVYERAFDLLVVLLIAALAATCFEFFYVVVLFVLLVVSVVGLVAKNSHWMLAAAAHFRRRGARRISRWVNILGQGIAGAADWMNPRSAGVSFLLGLVAWGLTSVAFVWLLGQLNISIPFMIAVAIYPVAMLAGAASMLPGGLASTEAAVVMLLLALDVPLVQATVAAVGIRLGTLWFSTLLGLSASLILEVVVGGHAHNPLVMRSQR